MACLANACRSLLRGSFVAVGGKDECSGFGEAFRDGGSDAGTGSSDEGDFVSEGNHGWGWI
jgi:hypothetical protein